MIVYRRVSGWVGGWLEKLNGNIKGHVILSTIYIMIVLLYRKTLLFNE